MMSFKTSFVSLLFCAIALVIQSISHESPDELYWKSILGNITMPKVVKVGLQEELNDGIVKLNPRFQILQDENKNYYHTGYARKNPVPKDGRVEYFTQEKLSSSGAKMMLHFNRIDDGSKFLPLRITKSMEIASNKLHTILNILSVNPKSVEAEYIEKMIKHCEEKGISGEVRYCATSLKAMVDFVKSMSNLKNTTFMVASTEEENDVLMEYTIQKAQKLVNDDQHNIECHKMNNPFVVFFCHNIRWTDIYSVSLLGANGKQMNAIAVCHKDTSEWYGTSDAFVLLNLKPGTKPICHFLSGDSIVWLRNES